MGRGALMLSTALAFGGVVLGSAILQTLVDEDLFKRRVLVYGAGRRAGSIARLRRRSDRRGFFVIGDLPAAGDAPSEIPETDKLRPRNDLLGMCADERVDEIVVAMDDRRQQFPMHNCSSAGSQAWKSSSSSASWSARPARSASTF